MVRLHLGRQLYEEESINEKGLTDNVRIMVYRIRHREYLDSDGNPYSAREKTLEYVYFYNVTNEVALVLADRWVQDMKLKNEIYEVLGVDKHYSIFD